MSDVISIMRLTGFNTHQFLIDIEFGTLKKNIGVWFLILKLTVAGSMLNLGIYTKIPRNDT